jgi:hypothetical protein
MHEKLLKLPQRLSPKSRSEIANRSYSFLQQQVFDSTRDLNGNEILTGRVSFSPSINLQVLRDADRQTLKALFSKLPPPSMDTLSGEYNGELLDQGGRVQNSLTSYLFQMYGAWTGKAFRPLSKNTGEGYNCFRSDGMMVSKLPMDTSIETSVLDNQSSLVIRYGARNRGLIGKLVGEIRQVSPSLLLGVGIYPPFSNRRSLLRKIHFVLSGPLGPYRDPSQ